MNYSLLVEEIQKSYEEGVTVEHAERLAGKFLHAQMTVAEHLRVADLDARMKKTGVKAIKAAIYLETVQKSDKKPSDVMIDAYVHRNELVQAEQKSMDEAEVDRDLLQNYLNIFNQAHVHFRTISRQSQGF